MAHEFKLDPTVIYSTWSERQVEIACEWLDQQLDKPGRLEYYLMSLIAEVRYLFSPPPPDFTLEQLKVKFKREWVKVPTKEELEAKKQEAIKARNAAAKARAIERVGGKVRKVVQEAPKSGNGT